jgi:hypothetical protein
VMDEKKYEPEVVPEMAEFDDDSSQTTAKL